MSQKILKIPATKNKTLIKFHGRKIEHPYKESPFGPHPKKSRNIPVETEKDFPPRKRGPRPFPTQRIRRVRRIMMVWEDSVGRGNTRGPRSTVCII